MEKIYLSRRNIEALLSKLNRRRKGESTECTIIKYDNKHPKYRQTIDSVMIIAIENDECYGDRQPGDVYELDLPNLTNQKRFKMKLKELNRKNIWSYSIWDSVFDSVRSSISSLVIDSVIDSVRRSVRDTLKDSVYNSVSNSVSNLVSDSINNSIKDSK